MSDNNASFFDKMVNTVQSTIAQAVPVSGVVASARDFIFDAVAERIHAAAKIKAQAVLTDTHRSLMFNIVWQNALLFLSILPVYLLHAPWPFYLAYAIVFAYTSYSVYQQRVLIGRLLATRSITQTLAAEIQVAIEQELTQLQSCQPPRPKGRGLRMSNAQV